MELPTPGEEAAQKTPVRTLSVPGYLATWYNVSTWVLFTVHGLDTWIHTDAAVSSVNTWFAIRAELSVVAKK